MATCRCSSPSRRNCRSSWASRMSKILCPPILLTPWKSLRSCWYVLARPQVFLAHYFRPRSNGATWFRPLSPTLLLSRLSRPFADCISCCRTTTRVMFSPPLPPFLMDCTARLLKLSRVVLALLAPRLLVLSFPLVPYVFILFYFS